jgi:RecA/RadA recombinase
MTLLDQIDKKFESGELGGFLERETYSTGIDYLDYLVGRINKDKSLSLGVNGGKMAYIGGFSGSGKSTIAIQMGWNIVKDDEDALMIIYDVEKSNSHNRVANLIGLNYDDDEYRALEERKIRIINTGTNTDDLQKTIREIYKVKMAAIGDVKFTAKGADEKTNWKKVRENITVMPPTVIIVDSLANLAPQSMDEEGEIRGETDPMRIAKSNNAMVKQIMNWIYDANIIIIWINHISKGIQMGYIKKDLRPIKWLKEDETLPGGSTAVFNSDFMIRMEQSKKLETDKELFVKGFLASLILCKSRSNASGFNINLVFDQYIGIDNVLTNYLMLKENNRIKGGGRGFYLENLEDIKFTQKEVKEYYTTNKKFKKAFNELVKEELSLYIKSIQGKDAGTGLELLDNIIDSKNKKNNDESDSDEEITEDSIKNMNKIELKKLVEEYELEVPKNFWKQDLDEIKDALIDSLFE